MIFEKSCVLTSCVLGLWWYVLLFSFHCFIVFFVFYDSSDIVLWRFDMIFKNLYLRKKSCFLTSCFLTFLLKMRNKLNHALSHHQMVVNKNSSEFFCQKYQLWEKILFPDSGMISHRMSLLHSFSSVIPTSCRGRCK